MVFLWEQKLLYDLMIRWCSWNVWGLNNLVKCRAVMAFLAVYTVGFCCILETRVREENFYSIFGRFGDSWRFTSNYNNSGIGRMWVSFTPSEVADQFISGLVTYLLLGDSIEVLCVYASNSNIESRIL